MINQAFLFLLLIFTTALTSFAAPATSGARGAWEVPVSKFSDFSVATSSPESLGKILLIDSAIAVNTSIVTDRPIKVVPGATINIAPGKTLTLNGQFEAGRQLVFTGTGRVIYGGGSVTNVYPEWRGAKGSATISDGNYYYTGAGASGPDSTEAFKATISDVEASASKFSGDLFRHKKAMSIELASGSSYRVIGDNPLGVQTTVLKSATYWRFNGNGSRILWEIVSDTDRCFGRLGKLVQPIIENVSIIPCAMGVNVSQPSAPRKGVVFSSKVGEANFTHQWGNGVFRNINVGPGINIVFNIEADAATGSHDDITLVENLNCEVFKTFIRFNHSEPVNWTVRKCALKSFTNNAIDIDIPANFSGGLFFEGCDFLISGNNTGETFLKMSAANNSTNPVIFANCRMETRNSHRYTFLDVTSGVVKVYGLNFNSGNSLPPHPETRAAIVGRTAIVEFNGCVLHNGFELQTSGTVSPISHDAIIANDCMFIVNFNEKAATLGYPIIFWKNATGTAVTYADLIASGEATRSIRVYPRYTNGLLTLPLEVGPRSRTDVLTSNIFRVNPGGVRNLHIPSGWELPPFSVITSIKLYHHNIDINKTNNLRITFTSDKERINFQKVFTTNKSIYGEELLAKNHIITAMGSTFTISAQYRTPSEKVETSADNMPSGYITIQYRPIHQMSDTPKGVIEYKLMYP